MSTPIPADEEARLAALRQYAILDTLAEKEFDDLARLASYICGVPIALINLIDSDRLWSKAQIGLPLAEMPRVDAFCAETIRSPDVLIVPDLRADERFAANPTVTADPHLRFYAGAPLVTAEGYALGTICVMDRIPRDLSAAQQDALQALARQVISQLELRRTATQLHQAVTARNEAEAIVRLRTQAIEAASSSILITDPALPDNPIIYANSAFTQLTGYLAAEVVGRNCRFLQGPDTDPQAVAQLRQALAATVPAQVRLLNYRKDGTPFWNDLVVSPVRGPFGQVTHFIGIQNDITQRQHAEEALRQQEEYFHALIDNALDVVLILDHEGVITYASPSTEGVTGRSNAQHGTRSFFEFIHDDDRPLLQETFRRVLQEPGGIVAVEFRLRRHDGSWRYIEAIAKNLLAVPSVRGVVVNARDTTRRKQAEQELQDQYAFTRAITSSVGEGVYALDRQGWLTFLNPAGERLLGWTAAELLGASMHDAIHYQRADGTRVAAADCPLLAVLASGIGMHSEEDVFTRKDGTLFPVTYTSAPIISEGQVTGMVLTFDDITERLHLQNQLKNQNRVLEQRVRERTRELEEASLEILERLSLAADFRDDDTGQHVARVGQMAAQIAQELGLPAEEVTLIGLAAPLHDVGKIGIPDQVLLKPAALTAEEFVRMQAHSGIGGGILAGSGFAVLNLAEQIALTHHEHWDGSGYPRSLSGEEIPLVGRITAVADVFDALTHQRPYKRAWLQAEAVAAITQGSGQHFDPRVVVAFLRVIAAATDGEGNTAFADC